MPKDTNASEGYEPNVKVAKTKLEPLGIKVSQVYNDEDLPYSNNRFDLIMNRHESFSAKELGRVLKPNGIFITQQVGGENDKELNEMLGCPIEMEYKDWNLNYALDELKNNGFKTMISKEEKVNSRFYDVGAVVYYLKAIPRQIPDFTIDKYYDALRDVHNYILNKGYLDTICHRFLIKASKL